MTGFIWIVTGYVIYLRKDFTEKPAEWLYVASVSLNYQVTYSHLPGRLSSWIIKKSEFQNFFCS